MEGFEFAGNDNTIVSWLTVYGRLKFWVFDLATLRIPAVLPHVWGESDAVAFNGALGKLILELGTATPCGWLELQLHNRAYIDRSINLPTSLCGGPPNAAVSSDGTLFASSQSLKLLTTSIWSVASHHRIQQWQQDVQFPGSLTFFDGTRGLVEAQGSHSGINLVTIVDLYRIADHHIVGQYKLRPVPHWSSELTSFVVLDGVLVAVEPTGEKSSNQGFLETYAYYAFPLPLLN
jgi:hypothetical protein